MSKTVTNMRYSGAIPIERWLNRLLSRLTSPHFIISLILIVILFYLIVVPLVQLVLDTLIWDAGSRRLSPDAIPGDFTSFYWKEITTGHSSKAMLLNPLMNSLVTGLIAAVIALVVGGLLAWLVTRTDMPGRPWLRPLFTLPYVIPSFAIALAWETFFKSPSLGGLPGMFEFVFGLSPPAWISYGPFPIIITMSIHYFPFAFLLISGSLATLDSQLEESGEILGLSRWTILRKITFPIVAPAIVSAFILTFGKTIGTFALPFLLGAPIQFHTMSTMLYANLTLGMDALGYALALILILITALVIYLSSRILGENIRRFETIGGKGFKGQPTRLGRWRWLAFSIAGTIALLTAILPILLLAYQTLMAVDGRYGLGNLTLHYWIGESHPDFAFGEPGFLHNNTIIRATWNTLKLGFISAGICAIIGLIIGYIVVRNRDSWISKLLEQISFVPFLFPAIAFGAMYLSLFAEARGPIPAFYGTFTLIVLISVIKRLPYSTRTGTAAVTQIGQELEEAAEIQGLSWFQRLWRIVFPLASSGVVAGMMVSFVGIMRELTLIILLITPATAVLMTVGFHYAEDGNTQLGNALVLWVTVLTIAGELIVWRLGKSRLVSGAWAKVD